MATIQRRTGGFISLVTDDESGEIAWLGVSDSLAELHEQAVGELKRQNSPQTTVLILPITASLRLDAPVNEDEPEEVDEIVEVPPYTPTRTRPT